MLSTISAGKIHEVDELKQLVDWGFEFIVAGFGDNLSELEAEVINAHAEGLKVLVRWPSLTATELNGAEFAFSAFDGRHNANASGRVGGPSHWNTDAEDISLAVLPGVVRTGIDGVLVSGMTSDRMFPTDWYPSGDKAIEGTKLYWSFDNFASSSWGKHSKHQPMPRRPEVVGGQCAPGQEVFYRWYQDGWVSKITRLSTAAIDMGLKHIWTWVLPHTRWTEVNMADGTAGCVDAVENWRQHVVGKGAEPIVVVANHFPLEIDWPEWFADSKETIERVCAPPYNWKLIIGADTVYQSNTVVQALGKHSVLAGTMGACGLLCGDQYIFDWEKGCGPYKDAFTSAKKVFQ